MFERILVLAPHTDDGEVGCGGTIAKFIEQKKNIYYVAFSSAQKSVRKGFPKNILEIEVKKAIQVLGVSPSNLILFDYEVRTFPEFRQEILEDIIKLRADIKPDLVIVPSLNDIHQDHAVIAREALRAFKKVTLLGYEEPWNNIVFETRSFIILDERHVQKKIEALRCYESQKHRSYLDEDFIWGLAHTRGTQIEVPYAEAFEVLRFVVNDR
ncbi:MAG: PIG-L family deacetylase [Desulfobacterales bacterium]|nr:PIG-L family deacetylase [Desulfobacterales bacterium]